VLNVHFRDLRNIKFNDQFEKADQDLFQLPEGSRAVCLDIPGASISVGSSIVPLASV